MARALNSFGINKRRMAKPPFSRRLQLLLKFFLRSGQFTSALLVISLLASVFVSTSAIGSEIYTRLGQELPAVLGTSTNVQTIQYSLYTTGSKPYCLAVVNPTSFMKLTDLQNGLVAGEHSNASGVHIISLPSLLDYCLLASQGSYNLSHTSYLGESSIALTSGASSGFVLNATGSFLDALDKLSLSGLLAVAAVSVAAWSFAIISSKRYLKKMDEQGLNYSSMNMPVAVLSLVILLAIFFFSLMFSVFIQNISIGIIDYLLGSSLLYSAIGASTILQAAVLSFIASILFFILFQAILARNDATSSSTLKSMTFLVLLVFLVASASSLPFLTSVSSASSLDYVTNRNGIVIIPSGTVFPLTTSFKIPQGINCSEYSAEIAYPAEIDHYRTLVRGVNIENSTYYYGWMLTAGSWPVRPYQIALGEQVAESLGVSPGDVVQVRDELTGNSAPFLITGIFRLNSAGNNMQEGVTTLSSAQAINNMAEGYYSYIRIPYGCTNSYSNTSEIQALGLSQLLNRILASQPQKIQSNLYSLFSGIQPLVNSMATLALTVAAATSVSIWFAAEVFLSSSGIRRIVRIRWEQGERRQSLTVSYIVFPAFLGYLSIIAAETAAAIIVKYGPFGSVFYQKLNLPGLEYFVLLFLVLATSLTLALYKSNRRFED